MTVEDSSELLLVVQSLLHTSKQIVGLNLNDDLNDHLLFKLQNEQELLRNKATDILEMKPELMSNEVRIILQECVTIEKRISHSLNLQKNRIQNILNPSDKSKIPKNGYLTEAHNYIGYFIDNHL
ncbi:hypothetical protein PASE110613_08310 [Paenibacillus sediminis]|uniref:Flagellar protein FliT n=1 Tax=Paenibacillus sediminis TaxID=664909 RepID=A0ABS4H2B2_9BACL|nr:hypothetical protein [Paenibacillus sediminis]MBP1936653.1 hypothetical protein [Paenibacillus sediminis]